MVRTLSLSLSTRVSNGPDRIRDTSIYVLYYVVVPVVDVVGVGWRVLAKESRRGWLCQHIYTWRILDLASGARYKVIID